MGRVFTLYDETKAEKLERRPSRTDGPEWPSGDSGFACGPSGYRGSGRPNAHQWSPQSLLDAMQRFSREPRVMGGSSPTPPSLISVRSRSVSEHCPQDSKEEQCCDWPMEPDFVQAGENID
jgi:hypothetical protein